MPSRSSPLAVLVLFSVLLCGSVGPATAQVGTVRFAAGLDSPVYLTAAPDDFTRVFVLENFGDVEILDVETGAPRATPFLTLANVGGNNRLVGLAFHPGYAENGYVYVYYQDAAGDLRLERYTRSAVDPDRADPATVHPVHALSPGGGHVGGWIGFGPDGFLYWQIGDNGNFQSFDAPNNGQNIVGELHGNVLRIDVDGDDFPADTERNYAIPDSNPFVDVVGEDEIWAYGLRNPWRGSFDRATGDYYLGDVGQNTREEIDYERADSPGGRNYGWRLREGTIATPNGGVGGPQPADGVDPVYDYTQGSGPSQGASVTGGYVYRGPIGELRGRYFFGDFESDRIWSLRIDRSTESVVEFLDWTDAFVPDVGTIELIVSFGEDARGDLYIVDFGGEIFRVVGPPAVPGVAGVGLLGLAVSLLLVGSIALVRAIGSLPI